MAEGWVTFASEVSVVVARGADGEAASFPDSAYTAAGAAAFPAVQLVRDRRAARLLWTRGG